jgi:hypothetical protein
MSDANDLVLRQRDDPAKGGIELSRVTPWGKPINIYGDCKAWIFGLNGKDGWFLEKVN